MASEPEVVAPGTETLERKRTSVSRGLFGRMPRSIGRYKVAGRIGEGAMGAVYAAHDPELDRAVAIKVVHEPERMRADEHARMVREARALAAVSHPNVVNVFEVGEVDGDEGSSVFIAMELVPARDLRTWMDEASPPWRNVLRVYLQAARGLAAAHAAGVVHRDFKPSNVLLGDDGRVRVVDFGLAKELSRTHTDSEPTQRPRASAEDLSASDLTATGVVLGTPAYMAPEQLRGRPVEPAADQYAFCVALWEALVGNRPFAGTTHEMLHDAIAEGKPRPPDGDRRPPRRILAVLRRGLAFDPARRWPSMQHLATQLERELVRSRRSSLAVVLMGGALLGAGILGWQQTQTPEPATCGTPNAERWDDAARRQLEAAFAAADLGSSWRRLETGVDERLRALAEASSTACTLPAEDRRRDLALACLRTRAASIDELVVVLQGGEPSTLRRAERALARLDPPDRCVEADPTGLAPPPVDVAPRVEALRGLLVRVDLLEATSRYDEAWALVTTLDEDASELGYAPLLAEIGLQKGETAVALGRHAEAESALELAHGLARAEGHDEVAMKAAKRLAHLTGVEMARKDDGLIWARHASAAAGRLGHDDPERIVRYEMGMIHTYAGEVERGAEILEQAARDLEAQHEGEPRHRIVVLRQLGGALLHLRRPDEARARFTEALALAEALAGPEGGHDVAALSYNLALAVEASDGDYAEAHRLFARAAELYARSLGSTHPDYCDARMHAGITLAAMERFDEGLPEAAAGLEGLRQALGADDPFVIQGELALGELLAQAGEHEEARRRITGAVTTAQAALGEHHPLVERGRNDLAALDTHD
jgi:eukaryotic-like serine/threonine-protein kinase